VAGYTKMVYSQTVTHPSINRARRRVTPLIETNVSKRVLTVCLSVSVRPSVPLSRSGIVSKRLKLIVEILSSPDSHNNILVF